MKGRSFNLKASSATDDQFAAVMRGSLPWLVWLFAMPLVATVMWRAHIKEGTALVPQLLGAGTVVLAWFLWRVTSARSQIGRGHHMLNILGCLGWVWAIATYGWTMRLFAIWLAGGFIGCLAWNMRYMVHPGGPEQIFETGKAPKRKRIDGQAAVRMFAARVPMIRATAVRLSTVAPALTAPWEPPAIEAPLDGGKPKKKAKEIDPHDVCRKFANNLYRYGRTTDADMNGVRLKWTSVEPWRASGELIGVPGVHTSEDLVGKRTSLASLSQTSINRLLLRVHPTNHSRALVDLILKDTLVETRWWEPPALDGLSVAAKGVPIGTFEDGRVETLTQPAVFKGKELVQNLTHIGIEGMNGSGKSNTARILVATDVAFIDALDWAIDTSKGVQTLRPVAYALDWAPTTVKEAKALVTFVVKRLIAARASYLANPKANRLGRSLDNWVPGCGIPFIRLIIEEALVVANELGNLVDLANLARSAGIGLILSLQRAHSNVLDTNIRAALGGTMSFGAKDSGDCFLLEDELSNAGADPAQWKNRHPGKHYLQMPVMDLEEMLTVARTDRVDEDKMFDWVVKHAPERDARIAAECPDHAAMLAAIDDRGVYAGRQTGALMLERLEAGEYGAPASKGKSTTTIDMGKPTAAGPVDDEADDDQFAGDTDDPDTTGPGDGKVVDFMDRRAERRRGDGSRRDFDHDIGPDEEEPTAAELAETLAGEMAEADDDLSDVERADLADAIKAIAAGDYDDDDDDVFAAHPDDLGLDLGERDSNGGLPRLGAQTYVRQFLRHKGPGWEFTPAELWRLIGNKIGKGDSWLRTELSGPCLELGYVERLGRIEEGRYAVTRKILEVLPPKPTSGVGQAR